MDERSDQIIAEVPVDFRQVGPDGRVWAEVGDKLGRGVLVEAFDEAGNRCRAEVVDYSEGRAELDLVLESFRSAS